MIRSPRIFIFCSIGRCSRLQSPGYHLYVARTYTVQAMRGFGSPHAGRIKQPLDDRTVDLSNKIALRKSVPKKTQQAHSFGRGQEQLLTIAQESCTGIFRSLLHCCFSLRSMKALFHLSWRWYRTLWFPKVCLTPSPTVKNKPTSYQCPIYLEDRRFETRSWSSCIPTTSRTSNCFPIRTCIEESPWLITVRTAKPGLEHMICVAGWDLI